MPRNIRFEVYFLLALLLGALIFALMSHNQNFDPSITHLQDVLRPPLSVPSVPDVNPCYLHRYLLGTDALGRDVFLRLTQGIGVALITGLLTTLLSLSIGILMGILSGYSSKMINGDHDSSILSSIRKMFSLNKIVMASADIFLCFPVIFLYLTVSSFTSPSLLIIIVVISLTSWMTTARIVRAEILSLRNRDFITIAHMNNTPAWLVVFRHFLPHMAPPLLVSATVSIAQVILTESTLSFIGVGPPAAKMASLGNIIYEGQAYILKAPWLLLFPGLTIWSLIVMLNSISKYLQDVFDPQKRLSLLSGTHAENP